MTFCGHEAHGKTSGRIHRAAKVPGGNCVNCHQFDTKTSRVISWKQIKLTALFRVGVGYKSYLYVAQRPLFFSEPFTMPLKQWTR